MLGPIGSHVMAIFRLLSPEEIDRYITRDKSGAVSEKAGAVDIAMKMASGGESMHHSHGGPRLDQKENNDDVIEDENKFPEGHEAKIIPLKDYSGVEAQPVPQKEDDASEEKQNFASKAVKPIPDSEAAKGGLASIGVLSASTIREQEQNRAREENSKRDSATVFLIKEREKMRTSKRKLAEQTAIKRYQSSAAQEFHEESEEDLLSEETDKSDMKGILLNKRNY